MKMWVFAIYCIFSFLGSSVAQNTPSSSNGKQDESSQLDTLLDAAGPQRNVIESVFIITCADKHGTGFLITSGVIVTNVHVIEGCDFGAILARSPRNKVIRFSKVVLDVSRDLALLIPSEPLKGGLELGSDKGIAVGTNVTAWGYPLIYKSGLPLLTVGYVAGFNDDSGNNTSVKHLVVNGAFNPGNSGGPVFVAKGSKVVAIVVWRHRLTSNNVPVVINGLEHPRGGMNTGTFSKTLPNGQTVSLFDSEAVGMVLDEFYNLVQVQIGEAISVSELKAMIVEKQLDLK
jgi:S1-C subfamily serine protease